MWSNGCGELDFGHILEHFSLYKIDILAQLHPQCGSGTTPLRLHLYLQYFLRAERMSGAVEPLTKKFERFEDT